MQNEQITEIKEVIAQFKYWAAIKEQLVSMLDKLHHTDTICMRIGHNNLPDSSATVNKFEIDTKNELRDIYTDYLQAKIAYVNNYIDMIRIKIHHITMPNYQYTPSHKRSEDTGCSNAGNTK